MSTYLSSSGLPFILHFPDSEPSAVATAVSGWMSRNQVFTVTINKDGGSPVNRFVLVNFGSATSMTVHDQDNYIGLPNISGGAMYAAYLTNGGLEVDTLKLLANAGGTAPAA